jgi:hypothetical protein
MRSGVVTRQEVVSSKKEVHVSEEVLLHAVVLIEYRLHLQQVLGRRASQSLLDAIAVDVELYVCSEPIDGAFDGKILLEIIIPLAVNIIHPVLAIDSDDTFVFLQNIRS